MSFECMTWAVKQKTGKMASKAVLLALANRTNHENAMCRPRIKLIAEDIEASEETVKRAIKELAEGGFLIVIPRFQEGSQLANDYKLNMGGGGKEGVGRETTQGGVGSNCAQGGIKVSPGWAQGDTPCNQEVEPGSRNQPPQPPGGGAPVGAGRKEKAQELVDLWNENAKESGTFPRARMTPAREGIFATRLKDKQWADDFVTALDWITNAPAAAHYRGDNDRQWVADLDFMLQNGKATSLAEKATATPQAPPEPATPATPQAEVPRWKKDRIAMRQLELENAKREITKLVAQGFSRATCPFRFEDAERGVRKAQEALDAELGGPGAESAATGLES